jgi:hypothetical protein
MFSYKFKTQNDYKQYVFIKNDFNGKEMSISYEDHRDLVSTTDHKNYRLLFVEIFNKAVLAKVACKNDFDEFLNLYIIIFLFNSLFGIVED